MKSKNKNKEIIIFNKKTDSNINLDDHENIPNKNIVKKEQQSENDNSKFTVKNCIYCDNTSLNSSNIIKYSCTPEKKCKICHLEKFLNNSWYTILKNEFTEDYMFKIKEFLHTKEIFYPKIEDIFTFANYFDIHATKIVVIGQDPYHNEGQANGLAFSVNKNVKLPASLRNIFKEITSGNEENTKIKKIPCGDLTRWAQQGVLLINTCLTVFKNKPDSHKKIGWSFFVDKIISEINNKCQNVVFLLWGKHAQNKINLITGDHLILKSAHPSPFSANKGFFGCKHFILANEYLRKHNKDPIVWH